MSLIARLIEAGTPADIIEEVAQLQAEKRLVEAAIADRRAKAAERQARKRERDAEVRDVTLCNVTERDKRDTPLSLSPNDNNSNPHTHTPVKQTPARKADPFPKPEWCDPQIWRDLKSNRKAKRLPCTATAHAKLIRDLDGMATDEWPPPRLLAEIVARGWAAAHDPRVDRKPNNGNSQRNQNGADKRDGVAKALDRRLGLDGFAGSAGQRTIGEGQADRFLPPPRTSGLR